MERNYKNVNLSSKWTKVGYYGAFGGLIFAIPLTLYMAYATIIDFRWNFIVAGAIGLALIWFCLFVIKNMATGHIKDNMIHFKKFRKPETRYTLDQVEGVKVYENRKDKYILVTMNSGTGPEKYLLPSSNLFYAGEQLNTETVLRQIAERNQNKEL